MKFGDRLRLAREAKGLVQDQLGKGLGTDGKDAGKAVITGWENNKHFPKVDQLAMMCERLQCSADFLLFGVQPSSEWPFGTALSQDQWQHLSPEDKKKIVEYAELLSGKPHQSGEFTGSGASQKPKMKRAA